MIYQNEFIYTVKIRLDNGEEASLKGVVPVPEKLPDDEANGLNRPTPEQIVKLVSEQIAKKALPIFTAMYGEKVERGRESQLFERKKKR